MYCLLCTVGVSALTVDVPPGMDLLCTVCVLPSTQLPSHAAAVLL
jgi:hypothetical protein